MREAHVIDGHFRILPSPTVNDQPRFFRLATLASVPPFMFVSPRL